MRIWHIRYIRFTPINYYTAYIAFRMDQAFGLCQMNFVWKATRCSELVLQSIQSCLKGYTQYVLNYSICYIIEFSQQKGPQLFQIKFIAWYLFLNIESSNFKYSDELEMFSIIWAMEKLHAQNIISVCCTFTVNHEKITVWPFWLLPFVCHIYIYIHIYVLLCKQ